MTLFNWVAVAALFLHFPLSGHSDDSDISANSDLFVVVLGIAQDAGFPQAGCQKDCCKNAWLNPTDRRFAASIAVVDQKSNQRFLFDCTPDFREQLHLLDQVAPVDSTSSKLGIDGILLTHAHIGHYAGLMHLGREAIGSDGVPVFGTPKMNRFLSTNGPWSQLVKLENIKLNQLKPDDSIQLNERITVKPFRVPHRDEFSDTVGFKIESPQKSLIYLPDIDKWSKWNRSIEDVVENVDVALIDGTFYSDGEILGRDMSQIPHPFVSESIARFSALAATQRSKIHFIHLNHTNPVLQHDGNPAQNNAARSIIRAGLKIAAQGGTIDLQ